MSALSSIFRVLFRSATSNVLKYLAVVTAVLLGLLLLMNALEALWLAPWAYSFGGKPALVGSWVGRFHTPSGASGAVYFDLHHFIGDGIANRSGSGKPRLHGEERWCFAGAAQKIYPLHGSSNSDASLVIVDFDPGRTPTDGVYFTSLKGRWSGDHLQLAGTARTLRDGKWLFSPHTPDGQTATVFELQHGDASAFQALCGPAR
jgi:hypothetical protein